MENLHQFVPCISIITSLDGSIIDVNPAFCDLIGYSAAELKNRKMELILSLATRIFQQTHFYPLLQMKGHAEEIYLTLRSKQGNDIPVLLNAVKKAVNDTELIFYAGLKIDQRNKFENEIIAAKKTAEKALLENTSLKSAQEELQTHAEELDRHISLVDRQNSQLKHLNHLTTHSLQEPVRKLIFSLSMLTVDENGSDMINVNKVRKAANEIHEKLKGLQQYIWLSNEDFLFTSIHLQEIITHTVENIKTANPELTLMIEMDQMEAIKGNREQLMILFYELFSNIVRFRKPGNIISVKLQSKIVSLNAFREIISKYKYIEYLNLEITDKGVGFDNAYKHEVFNMFRTFHPAAGSGVGLALSKKIVENHLGTIKLESKPDSGTTVILSLPLFH